jgi:hypothetical protein
VSKVNEFEFVAVSIMYIFVGWMFTRWLCVLLNNWLVWFSPPNSQVHPRRPSVGLVAWSC